MSYKNSRTPIILLAFANDRGRSLRQLDEEQRELKQILELAQRERKCEIIVLPAATPGDIIETFTKYQGQIRIFHYGGHSDQESLFLRKDFPGQNKTKASHLAEFLGTQENLELLFVNGCLSVTQAKFYHSNGAKAVLVTDRAIGDQAAREFSQLFYRSLAGGATISNAFRIAETGYRTKFGDIPRGLGLHESDKGLPWQLFPEDSHKWRLPLVAKHLTRIPTIDLGKEFIGREEDLLRLKERINRTSRVLLVNGLGGIGKTVLATAYVQSRYEDYDHLAWINLGEDLIASFTLNTELADTLGLPFEKEEDPNDRFHRILWVLQQLPGRNLLVIDNVQEQITVKAVRERLPGPPNWDVLLTSRMNLAGYEQIRLETITPEEAKLLFRTHLHGSYAEAELEELLEEIGYHTLTIELLARLLEKFNNILSLPELTANSVAN